MLGGVEWLADWALGPDDRHSYGALRGRRRGLRRRRDERANEHMRDELSFVITPAVLMGGQLKGQMVRWEKLDGKCPHGDAQRAMDCSPKGPDHATALQPREHGSGTRTLHHYGYLGQDVSGRKCYAV
ncbi:hypothetical protein B0T10DRAFT_459869 [Thelonectria olida]|uniref:Uncharacterized protein n=1 Tax=Thelonectria olida TaxID=1576542 RepID=A0A9P9ASB0_9HYPO|nr:hypothetical protein B0T10DRAFT_459869 [Thelonectria olida]